MHDYTHSPLNEEIEMPAGCYWKSEEDTLSYGGEEALYFVGNTSIVSSCCAGYFPPRNYIMVIGYVRAWQCKTNTEGIPVSELESITDEKTQEDIRVILQQRYGIEEVVFW